MTSESSPFSKPRRNADPLCAHRAGTESRQAPQARPGSWGHGRGPGSRPSGVLVPRTFPVLGNGEVSTTTAGPAPGSAADVRRTPPRAAQPQPRAARPSAGRCCGGRQGATWGDVRWWLWHEQGDAWWQREVGPVACRDPPWGWPVSLPACPSGPGAPQGKHLIHRLGEGRDGFLTGLSPVPDVAREAGAAAPAPPAPSRWGCRAGLGI